MHMPLIIAILALLALTLLLVLDRHANPEGTGIKGVRAYVARIARWAQQ